VIVQKHINFIERISAHEWVVNATVCYKRNDRITKEMRIQFRIPEFTEVAVDDGILTTLDHIEAELLLVDRINAS
jgi:hypothetical protein